MFRRTIALILVLTLVTGAWGALAVGSYSAHTPLPEGDDVKLENLRLAAKAIDGTEVESGEDFSFNDVVGPRTKRRGYGKAPNGRGAKVTGGGVAQAATTLYMALLKLPEDAVEIDPVSTYGSRFVDDYTDDTELAVITDYDADIDFSFQNLGDDLEIDMWLGDDDLWCVVTAGGSGVRLPLEAENDDEDDEDDEDEHELMSFLGVGGPLLREDLYDDDEDDYDNEDDDLETSMVYGLDDEADAPDLLASAELDCGGDRDVLHNVELAADCVNDTVLEPGDTFSFNDVVGPRTKKYGYRRAINGRGAKVTGGGVAQVASVLWLAVKDMDDITVVEKSTYGDRYNQHYVDRSSDAILTDYSSGRDFCFRYTGDDSITIYTYVEDGWLYCEVYEE